MINNISMITLGVHDLKASTQFYISHIGFQRMEFACEDIN